MDQCFPKVTLYPFFARVQIGPTSVHSADLVLQGIDRTACRSASAPIGSVVLKVSVNLEKCFGHARCEDLCPEVFATDPVEGKCVIKNSEVPPELEKKVILAVRNCPEFALQLSESETEKS